MDRLRRNYLLFFRQAWQILEPDTALQINWHHALLAKILQSEVFRITAKAPKICDWMFNVPPRTLKSSLITIFFPPWAWTVNPHLRFITASYSSGLASKHAFLSRLIIESNWYQERFGHIYQMQPDQNMKTFYVNDKLGFRKAVGTGGDATGEGANILIIDDPINPKKARSAVERQTVIDLWKSTFHNRINDKAIDVRMLVGQRVHQDDLFGYVEDNEGDNYKHICIPAETDAFIKPPELERFYKKKLFFIERFPKEVLDREKTSQGAIEYAGQYLQMPTPALGAIVPVTFIQRWKPDDLPKCTEAEAKTIFTEYEKYIVECEKVDKKPFPLDKWYIYKVVWNFYGDTANGLEKSDHSAVGAYCCTNNSNIYVRDVIVVNLQTPELCDAIYHFALRNGYTRKSSIIIEGKSNGHAVEQTLRKKYFLNVRLDKRDGIVSKYSKAERMMCHKEIFLSKRFHVLEGAPFVDPFILELKMFPNGKFDDQVDCGEGMCRNATGNMFGAYVGRG